MPPHGPFTISKPFLSDPIEMRLAILCSGQAGQHREMLDEVLLVPECSSIREAASEVLGKDIALWWNSLDEKSIFLNSNAQFGIACYQMATWVRISSLLPEIKLIAGYSLGELIGYFVAGGLSAIETLKLVRERARLMDESAGSQFKNEGCMVLWRGRVSPTTLAVRDRAIKENHLDIAIKSGRRGDQVARREAADHEDVLEDGRRKHDRIAVDGQSGQHPLDDGLQSHGR